MIARLPSWVRTLLVAAVLIPLPVVLSRVGPGLLSPVWARALALGFAFAVAAIGLNVVMGYAGQISLGHAAFLGVGAFASGYITSQLGMPFIVGVLAGAGVGAVVAFVIGLISLRIGGIYLAISTLAFGIAMFDGLFKTPLLTRGSAGMEHPRPQIGDFEFKENADYLVIVVALLIGIWVLDRNITRTKLGRALYAIRENEQVAASLGVNVALYKTGAFVIAGAMTGVAGSMYAALAGFVQDQNFPFYLSLLFVIMIVVGGLGSRVGAFIVASFFAIIPTLVRGVAPFLLDFEFLIGSGLLLFTLVRHPGGIAQALLEARELREAKRRKIVEDIEHDAPVMLSLPEPRGDAQVIPAGETVLAVRDLSVHFGGLRAVDGASFDVPAQKIVGLIGPNGAGKTTCFNAVSGLVRPTAGRIEFKGEDISRLPAHARAHRGMGRTFQLLGLAGNLTVTENLLLAQHRLATYPAPVSLLHPRNVARTETELGDTAREALSALGFERFADRPLRTLSHGQQRLVELAAALVTSPDILLLDEPSGGMAPNAAESLAERLIEIRDRLGRTVLLIEHHIPLVLAVCDTVHVLSAGQILASGTTSEIVRHPGVIEAYLGPTGARRAVRSREAT